MAPKKKTVKNAFYFFMMQVKESEEKKGRKFGNMKQVADFANEMWSTMTPDDKEPYVKMASRCKRQNCEDLTKKFTSLGVSYATLDAEERELEEANQLMTETVRQMVRGLSKNGLKSKVFYLCHVNYFYKSDKGDYCPAEVALSEFSLQKGLISTMHSYIDPGKLILGFRFEATDWSQKTHNIPFDDPQWTYGETNYYRLFCKIVNFLKRDENSVLPPIFTMPDSLNNNTSISAVKSLFATLAQSSTEDPGVFRIYPLPLLFFELRNHCIDGSVPRTTNKVLRLPTVAMAENEIEKDVFTYAKNLGCPFHEEKDLATYCSLSIVTRWVFTICDHCCHLIEIPLVLGKHCPMDADVERFSKQSPYDWQTKERDHRERHNPEEKNVKDKFVPTIIDHGRIREKNRAEEKGGFVPTIIDHGRIRDDLNMGAGATSLDSAPLPEVRLPKKPTYSTAIKNKTIVAAPKLSNTDFPEMGCRGRLRGGPRGGQSSNGRAAQYQEEGACGGEPSSYDDGAWTPVGRYASAAGGLGDPSRPTSSGASLRSPNSGDSGPGPYIPPGRRAELASNTSQHFNIPGEAGGRTPLTKEETTFVGRGRGSLRSGCKNSESNWPVSGRGSKMV